MRRALRRFPDRLPTFFVMILALLSAGAAAQQNNGPVDAKAKKTFASAEDWQNHGRPRSAIDDYRKANKQDGGRCVECLKRAYNLALEEKDYETAEAVIQEWLPIAATDQYRAGLHFWMGMALQNEGIAGKKSKFFDASCAEFKTALALDPHNAGVHYGYGVSLAYLGQDDAARTEFQNFLKQDTQNPELHSRAQLFLKRMDFARSRMAPDFKFTATDGKQISLDNLSGKVVLIDFWATWCGPCVAAMPHLRNIAHQFEGPQFVVLSVSVDTDEKKWKEFMAKNGMDWTQYREQGFEGAMTREFDVQAVPATFSISAEGILEDQNLGDSEIEKKLQKLIAKAQEEAQKAR